MAYVLFLLYTQIQLILPWEAGLLVLKTGQSQANQNELITLAPSMYFWPGSQGQADLPTYQPSPEMSEDVQDKYKIPAAAGLTGQCLLWTKWKPNFSSHTYWGSRRKRNGGSPLVVLGDRLLWTVLYDWSVHFLQSLGVRSGWGEGLAHRPGPRPACGTGNLPAFSPSAGLSAPGCARRGHMVGWVSLAEAWEGAFCLMFCSQADITGLLIIHLSQSPLNTHQYLQH